DTLDASVEKMILGTGIVKGTGNTSDNTLAGHASDNKLFGLGGADTLVGKTGNDVLDGGNGSDSMNGGAGDDLYVLSSLGDVIVELAEDVGGGIDTVRLGADIGDYSLDVE